MRRGARLSALHRGVVFAPGRSSAPDRSASRALYPAEYYVRLQSGPCSVPPWQRSFLAEADGPPGTPVSVGLVRPKPTGHRSPHRRMTPHEAPSASRDTGYLAHRQIDVKRNVTHRLG